ncbi:PorV/PorQ family protein [bacterium]|nr:PorV/PorQ family protein [bacterium]MBU1599112.1 PorV/PorQ family protein [bacterium]MBU2461936.1 PorV/PorQ family protein [bacterium]
MKRLIIILFIANLSFATPIDVGVGARSAGMGGAFCAVADDSSAIYWNPAGLSQIGSAEVSFIHENPFSAEATIDWLALAQPLGKKSGLGFGWLYKWASLEEGEEATKSKMKESEYILSLATKPYNTAISLGVNLKRLTISSEEGGGSGFGLDLGLLYTATSFPTPDFSCGLMMRNLASSVKNESFQNELRLGVAKKLLNEKLILAGDLNMKKEVNKEKKDWQWHIGMEVEPIEKIFLRLGLDDGDIACGVGSVFRMWKFNWSFLSEREYSLPSSQRFEVGFLF